MIRVVLDVDADGGLRRLDATGHAPVLSGGVSLVCGAVSSTLRSAARMLTEAPGIRVSGSAPEAGALQLTVVEVDPDRREYLSGITALLMRNLQDLALDSPSEVAVEMRHSSVDDPGNI